MLSTPNAKVITKSKSKRKVRIHHSTAHLMYTFFSWFLYQFTACAAPIFALLTREHRNCHPRNVDHRAPPSQGCLARGRRSGFHFYVKRIDMAIITLFCRWRCRPKSTMLHSSVTNIGRRNTSDDGEISRVLEAGG